MPEHTLTSYFIAIQQGADYAEPDLVMTKDGVLVCRHENEISGTTDVAEHREFARRRTRKVIDGAELEGWFTEDFTLAELKTLRARERIPDIRPANTRFDNQFEIPTFDELLSLLTWWNLKANLSAGSRSAAVLSQSVGVYPETKHPSYFEGIGLSMDRPLLKSLKSFKAPVCIQSFEVANLQRLRRKTKLPIVQLIEAEGAPYDFVAAGVTRTYADLIAPEGLKGIAKYANAIGPNKSLIIPRDRDNRLGSPTSLVKDAHVAGLALHPWTFRADSHFLPTETDLAAELSAFIKAGIDGFFTDHPSLAVQSIKRN